MEYTQHLADVRARQERVRPADTPREVAHPFGELTVPEYVDRWAVEQPDHHAVVMGEEVLTYADVAAQHGRWAGCLRAKGVAPGERVGVHVVGVRRHDERRRRRHPGGRGHRPARRGRARRGLRGPGALRALKPRRGPSVACGACPTTTRRRSTTSRSS